jgi:tetratricopeptide (TPR) repeat protein
VRLLHAGFISILLVQAPGLLPEEGEKPAGGAKAAGKAGEKASDTPRKTKGVAPDSSMNLDNLEGLSEFARKDLEEAVKTFEAVAGAAPGEVDGKALLKTIAMLKSVERKAPASPVPLFYLGVAYQMKRSYPEARRVLQKALKLNPRFHEAIVELADVHCWQKDWAGSLPLYDQAIGMEPRYLPALERRGYALIALDRLDEARDQLRKAEKLLPDGNRKELLAMLDEEIKGPDWSTTYTAEKENYILKTPVSQEFAEEMANHAELIRRAYDKVFSDIPKPSRKYRIVVFSDRDEYLRAGNPPQYAGYYLPLFRKLVLYKNARKKETLETLYHEAFHQYLHDYQDAAPQWFNEGLGEYFGAFEYAREGKRELMRSRPHAGRLNNAQHYIQTKACTPASELMVMSQAEMYHPEKAAVHYAQAWGMVYFMIEGPKPQYKATLVNYFRALQKGLDIKEAYAATFGRLDMEKFDAEWKGFIMGLAQPQR